MAAMQDPFREAVEAVQAVAAGKSRPEIRRMLAAEFRSRDVDEEMLPPALMDVLVKQIAAGTYDPDEPLVSVRRTGLLRVPFFRKMIRDSFESAVAEHGWEGVFRPGVVRVSEHLADRWSLFSGTLPHPPGRGLYAPEPDEVPPPARLVPDQDLRARIPELFEAPSPPPMPPSVRTGMLSPEGADLVFAWLDDGDATVAVYCPPGRLGILDPADAAAYLPLVQVAHAQDKVVAATADIRVTAGRLLPATVRVVPDRTPQP